MRSKQLYVTALRGVRRALGLTGLLDRMAASPRHTVRHLRSLLAIYDAEDLAALDLPWWTYDATRQVAAFLAHRPEARVFEFGSGASTLWLAQRAHHVTSVEHDGEFAEEVRGLLGDATNVTLRIVPPVPSATPAVSSAREGHEDLDFSDYVATIDDADGPFDLIVVDGRARLACLQRARDHLAPGGMIVFDDVLRTRYRPALTATDLRATVVAGAKPSLPYRDATALLRHPVASPPS